MRVGNVSSPAALAALVALLSAGCPPIADVQSDSAPERPRVFVVTTHDEDFASDPKPPEPDHNNGTAGFRATAAAAIDAAEQGQGGVHMGSTATEKQSDGTFRYKDFDTAVKCEGLRADAAALVGGCAAELYVANCAQVSGTIRPAECTACRALDTADQAVAAAGCPPREQFPTLRER